MRIHIVLSGQQKALDIDGGATVDDLKAQVAALFAAEIGGGEVYGIVRHKSGKPISEGTLDANNITGGDTLEAKVRQAGGSNVYTPAVKQVLVRDLRSLAAATQPLLAFVGLASCDQNHGEASIRRQQCPPAFLKVCEDYHLALRVLLIDKGFSTTQAKQIYDIDASWTAASQEAGGLVTRYTNVAVDGAQLWVYGTHMDRTDLGLSQSQPADWADPYRQCTLAGVDIGELGRAIMGNGGVLVVGNFYAEQATPVYAAGKEALADLRSLQRW